MTAEQTAGGGKVTREDAMTLVVRFLNDLRNKRETPRVPCWVRAIAGQRLRILRERDPIQAAVLVERERCAAIAEREGSEFLQRLEGSQGWEAANAIAAAIRNST